MEEVISGIEAFVGVRGWFRGDGPASRGNHIKRGLKRGFGQKEQLNDDLQ
jgi:hypothetical protein